MGKVFFLSPFFPFNAWLCWLAGAFRGQIQYVCLLNAVHIGASEGGRPRYRSKGSERACGDQIMHPSNSTSTRRTFALVDCTLVTCEAVIIALRMRSIICLTLTSMSGGPRRDLDAVHRPLLHLDVLPRRAGCLAPEQRGVARGRRGGRHVHVQVGPQHCKMGE